MRRLAICLSLALLAATWTGAPASAQEPAQPDPAKKAKAEALIAEAGADGVWRTDDAGQITHVQSGAKCSVADADDIVQLTKLVVYPRDKKGSDVSCSFIVEGKSGPTYLTLYVYAVEGRTARQLLDEAVAAIRKAQPAWTYRGSPEISVEITDKAGRKVAPLAARFSDDAKPERYSSVWVETIGNWAVKMRATYPQADANTSELMSITFWSSARMEVAGGE